MFKPRDRGLTLEDHPRFPSPGRLADRQAGMPTAVGKMLAFFCSRCRSSCCAVSGGFFSWPLT